MPFAIVETDAPIVQQFAPAVMKNVPIVPMKIFVVVVTPVLTV